MPTKRLTDYDRSRLNDPIRNLLKRLMHAAETPACMVGDKKQQRLLRATWPDDIRSRIEWLEDNSKDSLARESHPRIYIRSNEERDICYQVSFYNIRGRNVKPGFLPEDDVDFAAVQEFCRQDLENNRRYNEAARTFSNVLGHCTSAGQMVRVLPYIEQYMPKRVRESLLDAERKSRWPKDLPAAYELRPAVNELKTTLAMCSLLPEDIEQQGYLAVAYTRWK